MNLYDRFVVAGVRVPGAFVSYFSAPVREVSENAKTSTAQVLSLIDKWNAEGRTLLTTFHSFADGELFVSGYIFDNVATAEFSWHWQSNNEKDAMKLIGFQARPYAGEYAQEKEFQP